MPYFRHALNIMSCDSRFGILTCRLHDYRKDTRPIGCCRLAKGSRSGFNAIGTKCLLYCRVADTSSRVALFRSVLVQILPVRPLSTPLEPRARRVSLPILSATCFLLLPAACKAQDAPETGTPGLVQPKQDPEKETAANPNSRIANEDSNSVASAREYRMGPDDVVEINVFEAPEFNRKLRVSANGEISVPLLGGVHAGGLTAEELETVMVVRLREYMKDPHVGVFVSTVESHPISVLGAVKKPGVFQVRGAKTILEMLSMAEGLTEDAGDSLLVMRGAGLGTNANAGNDMKMGERDGLAEGSHIADTHVAGPIGEEGLEMENGKEAQTIRVNLANLLKSEDPQSNVLVYPGDIVKVVKAGVVYVVGEVKKPGGFVLKSDERMSVLKAIALAEGLTATSAKSGARIIRSDAQGAQREEIPINLGKILAGKAPDPTLSATDIIFVPNSNTKSAAYKGSEAAISALTSLLIFRW
jgi:polysaccharide export outer membrane protein